MRIKKRQDFIRTAVDVSSVSSMIIEEKPKAAATPKKEAGPVPAARTAQPKVV